MARLIAALAFGWCDGTVINEVPAVDVIDVTVAVIVNARFTVSFGLIGPQPVLQSGMINCRAVVKDCDDDGMFARLVAPGERACDVIEPPFIPVAVGAIVVLGVIDRGGGDERRAALRAAGKACEVDGGIGLGAGEERREPKP